MVVINVAVAEVVVIVCNVARNHAAGHRQRIAGSGIGSIYRRAAAEYRPVAADFPASHGYRSRRRILIGTRADSAAVAAGFCVSARDPFVDHSKVAGNSAA